MAKPVRPPAANPPANLSDTQRRAAIPRLLAWVKELEALEIGTIQTPDDPRITDLETRIEQTLAGIFGPGSHEYKVLVTAANLRPSFVGPIQITPDLYGGGHRPVGPPPLETQRGVAERCVRAATMLSAAARTMQEELGPSADAPGGRALRAYAEMDLHSAIEDAAGQLYQDGHYAHAILDAVKALNNLVRLRSGLDTDGDALVTTAFSPGNPILRFNDLQDESDRNEQKGFMMMFAGAVAGLRNPRAHKLIKDDPERALEFIAFVSLLAKLLDGPKKVSRPPA
jgi:uncharacterized protein (TIGR02391 family)